MKISLIYKSIQIKYTHTYAKLPHFRLRRASECGCLLTHIFVNDSLRFHSLFLSFSLNRIHNHEKVFIFVRPHLYDFVYRKNIILQRGFASLSSKFQINKKKKYSSYYDSNVYTFYKAK